MTVFEKSQKFIYRNARPLELALWKYHFEKGNKSDVLNILSAYQNEDGGFAYGIEPDNWNVNSTISVHGTQLKFLMRLTFPNAVTLL